MNDVPVSILIPAYNRLWSLPAAIESAKHQGLAVEIVVVDDGSMDGTWDWLSTQDDIIKVRQSNWGKPAAINLAFSLCTGEYVRFLDSDDLLIEDSTAALYKKAKEQDADIVVAGYVEEFAGTDEKNIVDIIICDDFIAQQLGECGSSHYSAFLFRKKFIEKISHRSEFAYRDDRIFMIEVACLEPKVSHLHQSTFIHHQHKKDRLQFRQGITHIVTNWQEYLLYRRIYWKLCADNKINTRRAEAISRSVWPVARRLAAIRMDEGVAAYDWVRSINPGFKIPELDAMDKVIRLLGFRGGVLCLRLIRLFRKFGLWPRHKAVT